MILNQSIFKFAINVKTLKMKVVIFIAAVVATVTFASSVKTNNTDWAVVLKEVQVYRDTLANATIAFKELAIAGDAKIGQKIAERLDVATAEAKPILDQILSQAEAETLTATEAENYFALITQIAIIALVDLKEEIESLPEKTIYELGVLYKSQSEVLSNIAIFVVTLLQ